MNKVLGGIVLQFRQFFKNLGPTKRLSIVIVSVIAVAAILVMTFMLSGKDFVPLLTNVPSDQMP